jgi:hypothetical protein
MGCANTLTQERATYPIRDASDAWRPLATGPDRTRSTWRCARRNPVRILLAGMCLALCLVGLAACGGGSSGGIGKGDEFIGTWVDKADKIEISRDGSAWVIRYVSEPRAGITGAPQVYSGDFTDGKLRIAGVGDITYLPSANAILAGGRQWTKAP